ncbi:MAG: alpha/beta hydrolase, partial [Myxococcales bacterium]|nr:alpha/beta hydrolase [Myxococcales bacterium]
MGTVKAGDQEVFWIEQGEGEPVVLIHGNWSTSSWWEPTLERAPSGFRWIAYDLRGRGKTKGPDSDYSLPSLAIDLRDLADALGIDRFHVVGHSLGSAIAMEFALQHPDRLFSLIAVAPAWIDGMPPRFHSEAQQRALAADRNLLSRALALLAPAAEHGSFWERLVEEGHRQRLQAALRNLDALTAWAPGDRLSTLRVPASVVSGDQDILLGPDLPRRVASILRARHEVIKGVGHCPNIEDPP